MLKKTIPGQEMRNSHIDTRVLLILLSVKKYVEANLRFLTQGGLHNSSGLVL